MIKGSKSLFQEDSKTGNVWNNEKWSKVEARNCNNAYVSSCFDSLRDFACWIRFSMVVGMGKSEMDFICDSSLTLLLCVTCWRSFKISEKENINNVTCGMCYERKVPVLYTRMLPRVDKWLTAKTQSPWNTTMNHQWNCLLAKHHSAVWHLEDCRSILKTEVLPYPDQSDKHQFVLF